MGQSPPPQTPPPQWLRQTNFSNPPTPFGLATPLDLDSIILYYIIFYYLVEFVQLTTECCWGQPSDPCQRGCLTSHACVMWGPRTLNADDDDDGFNNSMTWIQSFHNFSNSLPSMLPRFESHICQNTLYTSPVNLPLI